MKTRPLFAPSTLSLLALGGVMLPTGPALALDPFTDDTPLLNNAMLSSGVALGVADMNADGLDDVVRLDEAEHLQIEYQQPDGSFEQLDFGLVGGNSWNVVIGDVDGNGYNDIVTSGAYNQIKLLLANDRGDDFTMDFLPPPNIFAQCANLADIDNNGTLDLFVCHDDGLSSPYNNDGAGGFTYDTGLINAVSTVPSDNSGNYGATWADYDNDGDLDLYIAKCRQGVVDPMDGRRLNLLFQNDGMGGFVEVAEAAGLQPQAQSWSADFGDIDNDGDFDVFLVNHGMTSQLYINQGPGPGLGTFVDVTDASAITTELLDLGYGIQTYFEDFDNDTFIDLLVTGMDGVHWLFINNGDQTFTAEIDPFPTGNLGIQSAAVGDLNDDGFPDVLAGFAIGFNNPSGNPDRLFLNPGNANNYFNVRLTGVSSNVTAVGARVELNGAWGTQIREVRAGESYGVNNTATQHFGLGTETAIDSIVIHWPSGAVDMAMDPQPNQTVHIIEGCPETWYEDVDGDGFGDPGSTIGGCLPPAGFVADDTDCDDDNGDRFPGNPEVCDEIDNDCDDMVDEGVMDQCPSGSSSGEIDDTSDSGVDPTDGESTSGSPTTGPSPTASASATMTAGGGSGEDSSGDDTGAADSGGGGCRVSAPGHGAWLTLLLLGLLARRRETMG